MKVDELRGTPMAVGSLEEIIDDQHAIVSSVCFFYFEEIKKFLLKIRKKTRISFIS